MIITTVKVQELTLLLKRQDIKAKSHDHRHWTSPVKQYLKRQFDACTGRMLRNQRKAERCLSSAWVAGGSVPAASRLANNFNKMLKHQHAVHSTGHSGIAIMSSAGAEVCLPSRQKSSSQMVKHHPAPNSVTGRKPITGWGEPCSSKPKNTPRQRGSVGRGLEEEQPSSAVAAMPRNEDHPASKRRSSPVLNKLGQVPSF